MLFSGSAVLAAESPLKKQGSFTSHLKIWIPLSTRSRGANVAVRKCRPSGAHSQVTPLLALHEATGSAMSKTAIQNGDFRLQLCNLWEQLLPGKYQIQHLSQPQV